MPPASERPPIIELAVGIAVGSHRQGRGWIESLRIDTIELNNVLGLRWGVWMSIILFAGAAAYFLVTGRRHRPPDTREPSPYVEEPADGTDGTDATDATGATVATESVDTSAEHDLNAKNPSQTPPE